MPSSSGVPMVAVAVLIVVSGCTGFGATDAHQTSTESAAPTTVATATTTTTTSTTTTVPEWRQTLNDRTSGDKYNWLMVEPHYNSTTINETDSKRHFENLSAAKQAEFEQAVENGGKLDDPDAWTNPAFPRYVYYNGTWYSTMVTVG